jgi:uncharacterized protein (TIGR02145 family)
MQLILSLSGLLSDSSKQNYRYMKSMLKIAGLFLLIPSIILFNYCKKETNPLPTITTATISSITPTTATSGGNVTTGGGSTVSARGVCWNTASNPTIANSKTVDSAGTGIFISTITGLTATTTYYLRAYASNSIGSAYGSEISFTTLQPIPPVLTTTSATSITTTTALSGGSVTSDGGAPVTVQGVCWNTAHNPTTANIKTSDGPGVGNFVSSISGLLPNATYYLRAYATNSVGTGYGDEIILKTYTGTITDIEGNTYYTVTIGSQIWMAENLKTTKYLNGDLIGTTSPSTLDITNESTPKYQWAYADDENNVATYGRLYTWYAVADTRNVCPIGWHVSTQNDIATLREFLGGYTTTGGMLKEGGVSHWQSLNNGATNETSFTGLPGGYRAQSGQYVGLGEFGIWWTSTEDLYLDPTLYALSYDLYNNSIFFGAGSSSVRKHALSVRCIKD